MENNNKLIINYITFSIIFGTIWSLQFHSKKIKKIYYDPHIWLRWKNTKPWKNKIDNWWHNTNPWININPWKNKNPWYRK